MNNENIKIINEFNIKIYSFINYFNKYIEKINIGKISIDLLNEINIKYSNKVIKLNKLSSIIKENSKTLILNPFNKDLLEIIKNSILSCNLDIRAYIYENSIKVTCSDMTEDKRKKIIKIIKENAEKTKISIRNVKREFNNKIKNLKKNKNITEDEFNYYNKFFIYEINKNIKNMDILIKNKEKDLLKI